MSLIKRLSEHQGVESAWYFNGSVYAKVGDKRMKFDITDDIDNKVKKATRLTAYVFRKNIFHLSSLSFYCEYLNFRFRVSM